MFSVTPYKVDAASVNVDAVNAFLKAIGSTPAASPTTVPAPSMFDSLSKSISGLLGSKPAAPKVGADPSISDGNPGLGVIGGVMGGAAGGYLAASYVFKKSNFWSTIFGSMGAGAIVPIIGGNALSGWVPSLLAAYGASRYVHGGGKF